MHNVFEGTTSHLLASATLDFRAFGRVEGRCNFPHGWSEGLRTEIAGMTTSLKGLLKIELRRVPRLYLEWAYLLDLWPL